MPVFAGEASGAFNSAGGVIMAPGVSLHRWTRIRHAAEQNLRERPRADCVTVLSHSALPQSGSLIGVSLWNQKARARRAGYGVRLCEGLPFAALPRQPRIIPRLCQRIAITSHPADQPRT